MSYAVVRTQKMTAGVVKGIEIHDRRAKGGVSHTNPDIDWERSANNYDLHPAQNQNFTRAVKERITSLNLKRAVRKDAVVMAQILVTSDTPFFDELANSTAHGKDPIRTFFQSAYDFLSDRYGKENIISATVHLDERTPHMHFNFVPVTADGRLCAKEILTKHTLTEQQDAFRSAVGERFGLLRGVQKEEAVKQGKRRTHLETAEYKAALADAANAATLATKARQELSSIETRLAPLKREYDAKTAAVSGVKTFGKKLTLPEINSVRGKLGLERPETAAEYRQRLTRDFFPSLKRTYDRLILDYANYGKVIEERDSLKNKLEHRGLLEQMELNNLRHQVKRLPSLEAASEKWEIAYETITSNKVLLDLYNQTRRKIKALEAERQKEDEQEFGD
ncbi:plasmid recombination enzyme type 3 [Clostridia bacterium]|nr:plasmid recombination enzyme type 3 [Clostridia bacterium]